MKTAEELIAAEVAYQDSLWGSASERADISEGQCHDAAVAQLVALGAKREGAASEMAFSHVCGGYYFPESWSGFRDYGSDIANLVVAAAYITQEIRRRLLLGEDTTRSKRDVTKQPYTPSAG